MKNYIDASKNVCHFIIAGEFDEVESSDAKWLLTYLNDSSKGVMRRIDKDTSKRYAANLIQPKAYIDPFTVNQGMENKYDDIRNIVDRY